jgi:hypothetical protein
MTATPLARVTETFGDKAKLVEAIEKLAGEDLWLKRPIGRDKGLAHVSNSKLLRLHATFSAVKEKFGTRAKLIDAILEIEKRTKDAGYKERLSAWPVPRLWDTYRSTAKRHGIVTKSEGAGGAAAKAPKAAKAPAEAKADKTEKTEKPAKKAAAKSAAKKAAKKG